MGKMDSETLNMLKYGLKTLFSIKKNHENTIYSKGRSYICKGYIRDLVYTGN
jgi:hypothetical protein